MTPWAQRVAIAEACGWRYVKVLDNQDPWWFAPPETWRTYNVGYVFTACPEWKGVQILGGMKRLPDYVHDLNAMHEAEETMAEAQINAYEIRILHCLSPKTPSITHCIRATAAQRAEAFLKTVGKWREDSP